MDYQPSQGQPQPQGQAPSGGSQPAGGVGSGYGSKKSLWKWIVIYIIAGAVVYGLVYYFVWGRSGGYDYGAGAGAGQNYEYGK